ncbi:MAG: SpoIIE family protein phosphatase [SAR324 cluster bacterium]|nr:SpoIIE family protein phosphatase [SAR324 cluster bacterium]
MNRNILFVDDEVNILEAYKTILTPAQRRTSRRRKSQQQEYNLFFAENGERAVEIYQEQLDKGDPIAAGFFDMLMPGGIDGTETIRQIRLIDPSIMCVIVTAYADRDPKEIREFFDDQSMWLYLNKPFNDGEIRQLAQNLISSWNLRKENKEYSENLENLVKQRTKALNMELEKVSIVQRNLLPHSIPSYPNLEIGVYYDTCIELGGGGDYYDLIELPDDKLGIVVADASGHGPSAACIMAITRAFFRDLATKNDMSPGKLVQALNEKVDGNYPRGHFVTMLYVVIDLKTGLVTSANSAHPFLVCGQDQHYKIVETETGMILGMFMGEYPEHSMQLTPGDLIFMFTDGIEEHKNEKREEFGYGRILAACEEHGHEPTQQFIEKLIQQANEYRGNLPREDDFTCVAMRWKPDSSSQ